jgi:hypothetical protein
MRKSVRWGPTVPSQSLIFQLADAVVHRAICVWDARISCKTAVIEPSSRSTIEVSTAASSRKLAISLMIRSLWRARKLISASVMPKHITRQNIAYNLTTEWRSS